MRIDIERIAVMKRVRKEIGDISELADDIKHNGLINPITVVALGHGYRLLAGVRHGAQSRRAFG